MKVIIAGSRSFNDYDILCKVCDHLLKNQREVTIISGTAKGADQLGERYAKERNLSVIKFPADWGTHGKKAGYLRNKEMSNNSDALIAFWDLRSPGTKSMIELAREKGLKVKVHLMDLKI